MAPTLDYRAACALDEEGADFRFFGGFESVTDGKILWVKSDNLTIPVELSVAKIYLLPAEEDYQGNDVFDLDSAVPEHIRWDRVAALSEGAKVFIGGRARQAEGRVRFQSIQGEPLLVILYDGSERTLLARAVRAGRHRNEYWNFVTPYAIALGVFSELLVALSFAPRPAFRVAAVTALAAAFGPTIPILPPGILLTSVYRRFWRRGRAFRALRDLVLLPLRHLPDGVTRRQLPDGEFYGKTRLPDANRWIKKKNIPVLPPGIIADDAAPWLCFGVLPYEEGESESSLASTASEGLSESEDFEVPSEPKDPMAVFAAIPDDPVKLSRLFSTRARFFEIGASAAFLGAVGINVTLAFFLINSLH